MITMCILMSFITSSSSLTGTQERTCLCSSLVSLETISVPSISGLKGGHNFSVPCVRQKSFFTKEQSQSMRHEFPFEELERGWKSFSSSVPETIREEKKKIHFRLSLECGSLTYASGLKGKSSDMHSCLSHFETILKKERIQREQETFHSRLEGTN